MLFWVAEPGGELPPELGLKPVLESEFLEQCLQLFLGLFLLVEHNIRLNDEYNVSVMLYYK